MNMLLDTLTEKTRYMKLGVQGVTLLVSSGDNGVAGNSNKCCTEPNCRAKGKYNLAGATGYFNPSFPSTCPWITSVGATEIAPNAKVTAPERACSRVIYSGGGFSNFFTMPAYQSTAVPNYNKKYSIPSISSRYVFTCHRSASTYSS
jgi:tripeptidyl-peptidase-1